jgi:hypothetical protein
MCGLIRLVDADGDFKGLGFIEKKNPQKESYRAMHLYLRCQVPISFLGCLQAENRRGIHKEEESFLQKCHSDSLCLGRLQR